MQHNLSLYYKILHDIQQWLPEERVTRQRNMAMLVMGLYASMNIHLSKIASEWPLGGKLVSLTNRLRRTLVNPDIQVGVWYRPLAKQIVKQLAQARLRLVMDVTKVGAETRKLSIGLAYHKRVLPLGWRILPGKKGHASAKVQVDLLKEVSELLPADADVWVLADAGFQAVSVLRWLRCAGWHFVFRQPGNVTLCPAQGQARLFNAWPMAQGQTYTLGWVYFTQAHQFGPVWALIHWAQGEDEPWYLIADVPDTSLLIRLYRCRMWTEETYGDMKGHGFDLEATHLTDPDRIARLVLAVSITYVWLVALGSWVIKRGFRHFIDRKDRRDKSLFRLGWDWLKHAQRNNLPLLVRFLPYP